MGRPKKACEMELALEIQKFQYRLNPLHFFHIMHRCVLQVHKKTFKKINLSQTVIKQL